MLRFIAVVAALTLSAPRIAAQQERPLPPPDRTLDEAFSSIAVRGVYELPDGRLLIADARERRLTRADLSTGRVEAVGREGSGPTEYLLLQRFAPYRADSVVAFDFQQQRYLVLDPGGTPTRTFTYELTSPTGVRMLGLQFRSADARGNTYAEVPIRDITSGGASGGGLDSTAVLRVRADRSAMDTIDIILQPRQQMQALRGSGQQRIAVAAPRNPLAPRDEWAVFPDGRVAIVHAEPYYVEWVLPSGERGRSTPLPRQRIEVTDAVKAEVEARRAAELGRAVLTAHRVGGGESPRAIVGGLPPGMKLPALTNWPEEVPPFLAGEASVWPRPTGDLWVRRTERAGARGTLYDVLNARGELVERVRVPEGLEVVAFGASSIYTTRTDDDGLVYLQRHPVK